MRTHCPGLGGQEPAGHRALAEAASLTPLLLPLSVTGWLQPLYHPPPRQADQRPFFSRGGDKHICQVLLPQAAEGSPDGGQEGTRVSWDSLAGWAGGTLRQPTHGGNDSHGVEGAGESPLGWAARSAPPGQEPMQTEGRVAGPGLQATSLHEGGSNPSCPRLATFWLVWLGSEGRPRGHPSIRGLSSFAHTGPPTSHGGLRAQTHHRLLPRRGPTPQTGEPVPRGQMGRWFQQHTPLLLP